MNNNILKSIYLKNSNYKKKLKNKTLNEFIKKDTLIL